MKFEKNVGLAQFTTFKIGGPAEKFYLASQAEDFIKALKYAKKENWPYFILGGGSNILISDDGIKGLVIKCGLNEIEFQEEQVRAGAGVNINELIGQAAAKSLGGLEFLAGVPSTLGGAIWGNAGSEEEAIGGLVEIVKIVDMDEEDPEIKELSRADCQFGYRDSIFKHDSLVILEAVLKLKPTDGITEKIQEILNKKRTSQDLSNPSAGCIFVNPTGRKRAGQIIDELGLKGYKMGGAKVSEKHANFIINTGGAKAEDVIMLISYIKQQARDQMGIQLQEEVQYIGFDN